MANNIRILTSKYYAIPSSEVLVEGSWYTQKAKLVKLNSGDIIPEWQMDSTYRIDEKPRTVDVTAKYIWSTEKTISTQLWDIVVNQNDEINITWNDFRSLRSTDPGEFELITYIDNGLDLNYSHQTETRVFTPDGVCTKFTEEEPTITIERDLVHLNY